MVRPVRTCSTESRTEHGSTPLHQLSLTETLLPSTGGSMVVAPTGRTSSRPGFGTTIVGEPVSGKLGSSDPPGLDRAGPDRAGPGGTGAPAAGRRVGRLRGHGHRRLRRDAGTSRTAARGKGKGDGDDQQDGTRGRGHGPETATPADRFHICRWRGPDIRRMCPVATRNRLVETDPPGTRSTQEDPMIATSIALSPAPGVAPASRPRLVRGPQRHTHLSEPASRWVDWLRAGGRLTDTSRTARVGREPVRRRGRVDPDRFGPGDLDRSRDRRPDLTSVGPGAGDAQPGASVSTRAG